LENLELCGIAEGLMPEVAPDPFRKLCQSAHLADDSAFKFMLTAVQRLAGHSVL
jgi:uncharacterized protein YjeT (DUF2065 family)